MATGTADVAASLFCASGGYSGSGFIPEPYGGCPTVLDPYAALAHPTPDICAATNLIIKDNQTLSPGTYCGGLTVMAGGTANLLAGNYIFKDGPLEITSGGTVYGSSVTLFLSGSNAAIKARGGALIDVAAPTSGTYENLVIVQDPLANPGGVSSLEGGSDMRFVGTVYLPTQKLEVGGSGSIGASSPQFSLIADNFFIHGNGTITVAASSASFTTTAIATRGVKLSN